MSGKTVELESLIEINVALNKYLNLVSNRVCELKNNAKACSNVMENDQYSQKALNRLEGALAKISVALDNATNTRDRIQRKIDEIRDSEKILSCGGRF